jgi:P2-related tail formation protein
MLFPALTFHFHVDARWNPYPRTANLKAKRMIVIESVS